MSRGSQQTADSRRPDTTVSQTSKDIVDSVWAKAKAFGRQEFAMEIERLIEEIQKGSPGPFLNRIKGHIESELQETNRQSEIGNRK